MTKFIKSYTGHEIAECHDRKRPVEEETIELRKIDGFFAEY